MGRSPMSRGRRSHPSCRRPAHAALAAVALTLALMTGSILLPHGVPNVGPDDAFANEPTPRLTDLLGEIDLPKGGPLPSPSPTDDEAKDKSGKKKRSKGQDEKAGAVHTPEDGHLDPAPGGSAGQEDVDDPLPRLDVFVGVYRTPGSFNTDRLAAIAARLMAIGWFPEKIQRRVYAPFIIAGEASWVDTWGAHRTGPDPDQVRSHQGQDVFCAEGTPVLAAETGIVEFDEGGLGGRIARLFREGGGYWYYAHLSEWNTERFSSGDPVQVGDVIGYCGRTGNAQTTPPHVHFGWYDDTGARDPMGALIGWLEDAEKAAAETLAEGVVDRYRRMDSLRTARRFGDALTPGPARVLTDEELIAARAESLLDRFLVASGAPDPHGHHHEEVRLVAHPAP